MDIIGAMMIVWRYEEKLSGLFCGVLCATIVHSEVHRHINRPNSWLWSPCVADADIIFLPCGFFFFLLFFLAYFQPSQIGCLPYFHTLCGLSANLGCRSETCCTQLAENKEAKNRQKFAICAPSHNFIWLYLCN